MTPFSLGYFNHEKGCREGSSGKGTEFALKYYMQFQKTSVTLKLTKHSISKS